ncbi:proline-rich protein 22-like [Haliaeetus albicilla]|uniref:proline-rich protein 22-like n=1 Tax=Haliaeetus albicilla TaxID=8969 RepID=UPI0037E9B6CA
MARPPRQLPLPGPWGPPAPQLLQPFVLPETFYPPGLQRAPCGCLFDPRVYHIQWTATNLPPPATATLGQGAASLPGAALWGPWGCGAPLAWAAPGTPQGQPQYLAPYDNQARALAPAPTVLLTSIPGYQHTEGQSAKIDASGTAIPAGALPGSDVSPSPCAAPHDQAPGDNAGDFDVSEEMLIQEALRLFGCSPDAVGASQDAPKPGDAGGTSGEGTGVAPASPVLPTSIPGYQHIEGQSAKIDASGTATPAGAPPGSDVSPGSHVSPSPCAAPHSQAPGDTAADLAVPDKVLLEEALSLLGYSLDAVGASQDAPSSSPVPGDAGGTGAATPDWDFSPLSLPDELLTLDSCIPELSDTTLSLEIFNSVGMEPQEPWQDAGMDLPPSPPAVADAPRKRQAQSSLPVPPSKRRALADNMGKAARCPWDKDRPWGPGGDTDTHDNKGCEAFVLNPASVPSSGDRARCKALQSLKTITPFLASHRAQPRSPALPH